MAAFDAILSHLGAAAAALASNIIPGAAALPSLIKAGEALAASFHSVKEANGGTVPPDAQAQHDALMVKMNAHADGTLGRLEGGGG